ITASSGTSTRYSPSCWPRRTCVVIRPPVASVTAATVTMVEPSFQSRKPYRAVRLTQMIRKGTVCQGGLTCIATRFRPTKSTQAMSSQDDRTALRNRSVGTNRGQRDSGDADETCGATGACVMFDLPSRLVLTYQRAAELGEPTLTGDGAGRRALGGLPAPQAAFGEDEETGHQAQAGAHQDQRPAGPENRVVGRDVPARQPHVHH